MDKKKKRTNGLIDRYARAANKEAWLRSYEADNDQVPEGWAEKAMRTQNFIRHAPVFSHCKETNVVSLVPLNPVPTDGPSWEELLGYDPASDCIVNEEDYCKVYYLELPPLTGEPLSAHSGPKYSVAENEDVSTNEALPPFARLDFSVVPVEMQPSCVLKDWLRARRVVPRRGDERATLERMVKTCMSLKKTVAPPALQLKSGKYNSFEALTFRNAGNSFDVWSKNYFPFVQLKVLKISDESLNEKLGNALKGTRRRALALVRDGNLDPKSIQCLNVQSKINGEACVLLRCDCLSSERKTVHIVNAVFKDELLGDFPPAPLSTCSCEDGSLFCSHMLALLLLVGIVQEEKSQEEFEEAYPVSPALTQAIPMLVECLVIKDKFNRSVGQKRRRNNNLTKEVRRSARRKR